MEFVPQCAQRSYERNYHFIDELAYTEDNCLVYNIYFYKVPKKVTLNTLSTYFQTFGEVLKINFTLDKSKKCFPTRSGYVYFKSPKSAANVLKKNIHKVLLHRQQQISVKACHTWYQPQYANQILSAKSVNNETLNINTVAGSSLLDLNDDCLIQIARKLNLNYQIRLAHTSQRLADVATICWKAEYTKFDILNLSTLTLWEMRQFFIIFGGHIEEIIGSMPNSLQSMIVEFMAYHDKCSQVKRLQLDFCKLNPTNLFKLCRCMKEITEINFHETGLIDKAISSFQKLPKLETLILNGNSELTGKYMDQLKTVRNLNLSNCVNLQTTYMLKTIQALPNLKSLNIQNCTRLSSNVFDAIVNNCKELETLQISCGKSYYECVAKLPKLKHLELSSSSPYLPIRQQLFDALVEHKTGLEYLKILANNAIAIRQAKQLSSIITLKHLICRKCDLLDDDCLREFEKLKQLEELVVCSCNGVTDTGLLSLLRQCTNLKNIVVHGCKQITDLFVFNAITTLEERQNDGAPINCVVSNTAVNNMVLKDTRYLKAVTDKLILVHCDLQWELLTDLFGCNDEYDCFDDFLNDYEYDGYDDYDDDDDDFLDDDDYLYSDSDDDLMNGFVIQFNDGFDEHDIDRIIHDAYNEFGGFGNFDLV